MSRLPAGQVFYTAFEGEETDLWSQPQNHCRGTGAMLQKQLTCKTSFTPWWSYMEIKGHRVVG